MHLFTFQMHSSCDFLVYMATCYWCIVQSGSGTVCDRPKQALFVPLGCEALTHKLRAPSLKIQENEKHECRLAQNRLVRDKLTVQGHCVRLNRVTSHQLIYLSLYNCQLLMGKTRTSANQLLFFFLQLLLQSWLPEAALYHSRSSHHFSVGSAIPSSALFSVCRAFL